MIQDVAAWKKNKSAAPVLSKPNSVKSGVEPVSAWISTRSKSPAAKNEKLETIKAATVTAEEEAKKANSFGGMLKNTLTGIPSVVGKAGKFVLNKIYDVAGGIVLPGASPEELRNPTLLKDTALGIPKAVFKTAKQVIKNPIDSAKSAVGGAARGVSDFITNAMINITPEKFTGVDRDSLKEAVKETLDKYLSPEVIEGPNANGTKIGEGFHTAGQVAPLIALGAGGEALAARAGVSRLLGETAGFAAGGQTQLPLDADIKDRADQVLTDLVGLGLFKAGTYAYNRAKSTITASLRNKTNQGKSTEHAAENFQTSGHDLDRAIEAGDIPVNKVYKNKSGQLQPEYVAHVVSDLAGKLDMYQKGLGEKFAKSVDTSNPTPTNLDGQALAFLNKNTNTVGSAGSPDFVAPRVAEAPAVLSPKEWVEAGKPPTTEAVMKTESVQRSEPMHDVRTVMEGLSDGGYKVNDITKIMEKLFEKNPNGKFSPREVAAEAAQYKPEPKKGVTVKKEGDVEVQKKGNEVVSVLKGVRPEVKTNQADLAGVPSKSIVAQSRPSTGASPLSTRKTFVGQEGAAGSSYETRYTPSSQSNNFSDIRVHNTTMREHAQANLANFKSHIEEVTGIAPEARVKTEASLNDKITRTKAEGREISEINDVLAGRIVVKDGDPSGSINKIKSAFDVKKLKDYFSEQTDWGYRGANIVVDLPNKGGLAEIQIHTPESLKVLDAIHPIYEKWRTKPIEKLTPEERIEYDRDKQRSNKIAEEIFNEKKKSTEEFASSVFERMKSEHPQLKGDVTYNEINLKKDAERAVELIAKDKQEAYEIAMGSKESADVTSTATNIALFEKAVKEGDFNLAERLVRNRSLAQTRRGQEIVSEKGSITDNSTAKYVKELISTRLDILGKNYLSDLGNKIKKTTDKAKATNLIDREVRKLETNIKEKKIDTKTALKLLDELTCL